jgi:hypothetical protein
MRPQPRGPACTLTSHKRPGVVGQQLPQPPLPLLQRHNPQPQAQALLLLLLLLLLVLLVVVLARAHAAECRAATAVTTGAAAFAGLVWAVSGVRARVGHRVTPVQDGNCLLQLLVARRLQQLLPCVAAG